MNIPNINIAFALNEKIIILFDNSEIKAFDKTNLIQNKHTKIITKSENWSKIKYDKFSIFWTSYKPFGSFYEIGSDSIYALSEPFTNTTAVLPILRKKKGYTQNKLAAKMKVEPKDLSAVENGKLIRLDIIQNAFSILL